MLGVYAHDVVESWAICAGVVGVWQSMKKSNRNVRNLASEHFRAWLLDYRKWLLLELVVVILAAGGAFGSGRFGIAIGSNPLGIAIGIFAFWQISVTAGYLFFVVTSFLFVWLSGKQVHDNPWRTLIAAVPTLIVASQLQRSALSIMLHIEVTWWDRALALFRYGLLGSLIAVLAVMVSRGNRHNQRVAAAADTQIAPEEPDGQSPVSNSGDSETGIDVQGNADLPDDDTVPLYLASDDHHVKIVYQDRIEITRSSLKKEMKRWEGHGLQVHRSYWIREKAIASRHRRGRQLVFVLTDGLEIPVGRSYEKAILEICEESRRMMLDIPDSGQTVQGSAS